jgi:hypothetical protein
MQVAVADALHKLADGAKPGGHHHRGLALAAQLCCGCGAWFPESVVRRQQGALHNLPA